MSKADGKAAAELVATLREKMIAELSERYCGKKNCEHCRNMVLLFEKAVRHDAEWKSLGEKHD